MSTSNNPRETETVSPQRRLISWPLTLIAITLVLLFIANSVSAWGRRDSNDLSEVKGHVQALGEGHLDARVPVEGRDEIAELARAFNLTANRIAGLVNDKTRLLAHTSHELRTPLARIRVALELLRENPRPELLARVDRDIEELDELIGELLVASRMDSPEQNLATEPVDLLALCAEKAARIGRIDVAGDSGGAALAEGDPRLLRRLIRNLLQNALRHGERPVDVLVRNADPENARAKDAGRAIVQLIVSDCGPGIPEGERERILEPFYRRDGEASAERGIGLGLALVRQIALRHGGQIVCAARNGGGTRFILSLPESPSAIDGPGA